MIRNEDKITSSFLTMYLGNLIKHLHQTGAKSKNRLDMQINPTTDIKKYGQF